MTQRPYQRHWKKHQEQIQSKRDEDEFITKVPYHIEPEEIPKSAHEFYHDFGPIRHQTTNEIIKDLAPYQYEIWDCPALTVLVDKCQKSGITTSELLHDFQETITVGKGKDCLVVAQSQEHANEHIYTLKRMIVGSEKYRKYMITKSSELFFREEQTKVSTIFLKNLDNPFRPSRIIGRGFSQRALWSWKNAFRVHMSDPTIAGVINDGGVYATAKGRLANTNGRMMIESPPNGMRGKFYEWYEQFKDNHDPNFKVFLVVDEDAKRAGVISEEFLEQQKIEMAHLYAQFYQGSFEATSGAHLFSKKSIDDALARPYNPDVFREQTEKYILVDQGYVTSQFAILVLEYLPKIKRIQVLLAEEVDSPMYEEMVQKVLTYRKLFGNVQNIGFDATSRQEYGMSLKYRIGEPHKWSYVKEKMRQAKENDWDIAKMMHVVPIIFSTESKLFMSSHARHVLDDPRGFVAIDPRFKNLETGLRGAVYDDSGMLDKKISPHNDLADDFMMGMTFFHFGKKDR